MTANRSRNFFADFRDFILRGNVIDLAVAVIIGGAFNGIINSLVEDIVTPAILSPAIKAAGVDKLSDLSISGIKYGLFLSSVINFLVIAFCLFFIIRIFEGVKQKLIRKEELALAEESAIEKEEAKEEILVQENLTKAIEALTEVINNKSINN
ncbi:large-conductance mechanosensitive channel [Geminocystis sp. NIES-3708]|uniref:large conductance mechanosensitive channel protein MscL n=1 Tax=Geminocystis sp. NIES-3708 TaxID=1615909 RepID=UPI0005FC8125|nr:large conductance mechanosensitive channel protein MscL [Geminocystis sp. NIES-3708]BAQ62322.1 large-conductance mechanosensitive channel [Geminocystis sp. NIES-3708]